MKLIQTTHNHNVRLKSIYLYFFTMLSIFCQLKEYILYNVEQIVSVLDRDNTKTIKGIIYGWIVERVAQKMSPFSATKKNINRLPLDTGIVHHF